MDTKLAKQMIDYADKNHLRDTDKMRVLANEFEEKMTAFVKGQGRVQSAVGAWARARRYWCETTGEDLI